MHPLERRKIKNGTGLLAHLQLKNSKIIYGVDFTENREVNEILGNPKNKSWLLYPGDNSCNISAKSKVLKDKSINNIVFILDGTWPCAKKIFKNSKNLHSVEKLSFSGNKISEFIYKQQPLASCLSTIESIDLLLKNFIQEEIESCNMERFLEPFHELVKHQIMFTDNSKIKNVYKGPKRRKVF